MLSSKVSAGYSRVLSKKLKADRNCETGDRRMVKVLEVL